jgi:hypothetical protein
MVIEFALSQDLSDLFDGQRLLVVQLIGQSAWGMGYLLMCASYFFTMAVVLTVHCAISSMISRSILPPISSE